MNLNKAPLTRKNIPLSDGWEIKRLEEVVDYKNGKSFEDYITENGNYFLITLNSLDIEGRLKNDHLRIDFNDKSLNKDDLIMILSDVAHGYFLGLTDIIPEDNKYVLNQRVGALKNVRHLTPYYLSKYINLNQRYFKAIGQGSSQQNLSKDDILNFEVLFPTSSEEQTAIATALSDADALISSLEKLIAKKRNIKQGAMQELLTGKKRLSGFGGEWEMMNLSQSSTLKARIGWQGLTTAEYMESGDYYLVTGTDFLNGYINWVKCCFVDKSRYLQDMNIQLKTGDVLLTKDGTIGKVGYIDAIPKPATLNSGIFVIRPKNNSFFPLFLYYILTSRIFDEFLVKLQAGSTISHLYQKDFINFSFMTPKYKEQLAIAQILSDMDAEIEQLEEQLNKYKMIKQGMMQELLTGRIRLV